jgi:hypothetical protein
MEATASDHAIAKTSALIWSKGAYRRFGVASPFEVAAPVSR